MAMKFGLLSSDIVIIPYNDHQRSLSSIQQVREICRGKKKIQAPRRIAVSPRKVSLLIGAIAEVRDRETSYGFIRSDERNARY